MPGNWEQQANAYCMHVSCYGTYEYLGIHTQLLDYIVNNSSNYSLYYSCQLLLYMPAGIHVVHIRLLLYRGMGDKYMQGMGVIYLFGCLPGGLI